jgi:hypothetical protein
MALVLVVEAGLLITTLAELADLTEVAEAEMQILQIAYPQMD